MLISTNFTAEMNSRLFFKDLVEISKGLNDLFWAVNF